MALKKNQALWVGKREEVFMAVFPFLSKGAAVRQITERNGGMAGWVIRVVNGKAVERVYDPDLGIE